MKPHMDEAWRALRLADRDIQAFYVLKESPQVHVTIICFHAHQAVEKALKAVLFTRQIEFRRTHNLADLAALLRQNGVEVPLADDDLLRLNPFAVTFRYDDMDIALLTPAEAVAWVSDMRAWAEKQVRAADEEVDGTSDH